MAQPISLERETTRFAWVRPVNPYALLITSACAIGLTALAIKLLTIDGQEFSLEFEIPNIINLKLNCGNAN